MSLLETNHLNHIEERIIQSGIEDESLKIDLMDHICCHIEDELEQGASFEQAYNQVMEIFKVSKLSAIKEETEYLTKSNIIMKKRTVIIGIISVVLIVLGVVLKTTHTIGANITLILGFATLTFGFVLTNLLDRFQYIADNGTKWWHLTGHTALIGLISGIVMKILHLPGGNVVIGVSVIVLAVSFLIVSSFKGLLKT